MRNFAFAGTIAGIKFVPVFMLAIAVTLFTSPIRRTCDKGTGPEIVVDKS